MLSNLRSQKYAYLFTCFDLDDNGVLEQSDYEQFATNLAGAYDLAIGTPAYARMHAETLALWDFVRNIADHDGDGRVSCQEFSAGYEAMCADDEVFARLLMGYAEYVIRTGDRDGSGYLDADEYVTILSCYGISDVEARGAFGRLDSDADGRLSLADMERSFEEFFRSDDESSPGNWMMGSF